MHQTPNSNSGIRAMGFHMLNFDIHVFEKILKSKFSWYIRCKDGSLNLKFNFKFSFKIYNWYIVICIDLNFDLERILVNIHVKYRCMYEI